MALPSATAAALKGVPLRGIQDGEEQDTGPDSSDVNLGMISMDRLWNLPTQRMRCLLLSVYICMYVCMFTGSLAWGVGRRWGRVGMGAVD